MEVREDEVKPFNGSNKGVQHLGSILPAVKMPLMYLMRFSGRRKGRRVWCCEGASAAVYKVKERARGRVAEPRKGGEALK